MLFNSFEFLLFFPIVTILFFVMPHRFRWSLLLTASCFFYMFFIPVYILILFGTIIIDYFEGIYLEKTVDPKRKKIYLIFSLIDNIGVLDVFKYYNYGISAYKLASFGLMLAKNLSYEKVYFINTYSIKYLHSIFC